MEHSRPAEANGQLFVGRFQPRTVVCLEREIVNSPGGASSVSVVPAPSVAPRPTRTGVG